MSEHGRHHHEEEDDERRAPPTHRDTVLNEADRQLARVIVAEIKKHLGIKDTAEFREEQRLLKQIFPMLQTMHDSYKWKRQLYEWWMTTMGKTILWGATTFVFLCLLYGGAQAFRHMLEKATT